MTREALAEALGLKMEVDAGIVERLEKRFAARGWVMPEVNKRQANVFVGQTTLTNERGTAPGFHIEHGRQTRLGFSRRAARAGVDGGDVPDAVAGVDRPAASRVSAAC